jgi:uracil DNA glycosylase
MRTAISAWEALAREVIERINATRDGVLIPSLGTQCRGARPQHRPQPPCGVVTAHPSPLARGKDREGHASVCFRPALRHGEFGAAKPRPAGDRLEAR